MRDSDIDRILSSREEIIPSSGFTDSVIDAVRREASAPPSVSVLWTRLVIGLFAAAIVLTWLGIETAEFLWQGLAPKFASDATSFFDWTLRAGRSFGVSWIALASVLSFASVKFSNWLTREE